MNQEIRNAYDFFRRHAGGIVGQSAKTALALAKAEHEAQERGWFVGWVADDEPWDCDCGNPDCNPDEVLGCVLYDSQGEVLESLWGIGDPGNAYARLVAAELALEALERVKRWERRGQEFERRYSGRVMGFLKPLFGPSLADKMTYAAKAAYTTHGGITR